MNLTVIIDVNSEALKIYNINTSKEIIGTNLLELIPEGTRADMQKMGKMRLKGIAPNSYRSEGIKRDGTIFPVTVYPTLIKLRGKLLTLTFIEDITELVNSETESERIQNQLMKSHKLESLGILAGGIAHDFNNLLMIIKGGLELLTLSDNFNADQMDLTQELLDASNNATNLTNQLLLYTGRSKIETESNRLIDLFEELKGLIKLSTRNHISLNYHFDIDENVYVQLTNSQFSQLILNLVINSSRACLDTDAEICISSQVVSKDEINLNAPNTHIEGEVKNCDFVNIQIKDNGIGMDEVLIARIFDPFFTNTKGGRGLGLSVVQGIVFQNRGVIQVKSSLGNGTSIDIYLPLTKSSIEKKDMKGKKHDNILLSKTILLCEDDPAVRKIITMMLKRLEHLVIEAEDGVIGIQKFEANMKQIDLVILDLTMPNMSGKETFNQLIRLKKDIPILISSGYSEESISEFADYEYVDFLQKPYKLADLNSKINDILTL